MSFEALISTLKGGAGSGNFGHAGRPGKIGGSIARGADKGGAGIGGSGGYVHTPMDTKTRNALNAMATNDYQKRGGNYPRSGVPDYISVADYHDQIKLTAEFKNTSEGVAENWLRNHVQSVAGKIANSGVYETWQSGDYKDDWVTVTATLNTL